MEQRISLITLGVHDVARSRAFLEALGWTAAPGFGDEVAFFQCGGMALGLYPFAALAEDAGVAPAVGGGTAAAIAFNARSRAGVDEVLAEAVAAGAEIVRPAEDKFWGGYSGYFRDPDGHLWEVAWNPHFPLDDDGALSLPG